jgi:hypothetical protein
MNSTKKSILKSAAAVTAVCLTFASCGKSGDSGDSSSQNSSSGAGTAAPAVTLQLDSEPDSSSETDSAEEVSADDYTPTMWLVTSPEGNTMYMMGSMHALRDECYPLPDYVTEAYEQADVLAVECDITDLTASFTAGLKQMENMNYSDGTTLHDHLTEEQYANIESYMSAHGDKLSLYDEYQLWYLSQVLESMAMEDAELDSSKGFDVHMLNAAHDDGKEIYEVESIDFQMDLLVGISEDIYRVALEGYSEESVDEIAEQYEEMYEAWRTGNVAEIEELNLSEDEDGEMTDEERALVDEYNKLMLSDRNIGMAEKAEELMSDGKNVFYVVGAAHFVGDGGIIDLLTKDGYTCELVEAAE